MFGLIDPNELPYLPEGWGYLLSSTDWVYVVDSKGKKYLFQMEDGKAWADSSKKASLWDWIRTRGKLKIGQDFLDDRNRVHFTQSDFPAFIDTRLGKPWESPRE